MDAIALPGLLPTPRTATPAPAPAATSRPRSTAFEESRERARKQRGIAGDVKSTPGARALRTSDFAQAFALSGQATRTGPGAGA